MRPRYTFLYPILLILAVGLAACVPSSPVPDRPPAEGTTPTPLPTAGGWTPASQPITLRNATTLRELGTLAVPEPPSTVFAHALPLDNTRLYGLNNNHLLGWDLQTGQLLFENPRDDATHIFVSPDRRRIYTLANTGANGLLRIYTADTGTPVENFRLIDANNNTVAYDPLSGLLAVGSSSGQIQVWDVPARQGAALLETGGGAITALAFSAEADHLLAADQNGTLTWWDINTRERIAALDLLMPVYTLVITPNDRYALVDSFDGALRISLPDLTINEGFAQQASAGVFTLIKDGRILLHGGGAQDLTLWDIETGELTASLPDTAGDRISAASSDGALLFVGKLGIGAEVWNLSNLEQGTALRGALRIDDAQLRQLVWTSDGYQLLFFTTRGPIRVWGAAP